MKIYLAGPISSQPVNSKQLFLDEAERVKEHYMDNAFGRGLDLLEILNPRAHQVPEGCETVWETMMALSLKDMLTADVIVFLYGWEDSRGALVEALLARELNIPCYTWDFSDHFYRELHFSDYAKHIRENIL